MFDTSTTLRADPQNVDAVWMKIGSSMFVLYFDGHPLAMLYYNDYQISDNVASTHGAGVLVQRWAAWARDLEGKKKMPEKRIVPQQDMNEKVACAFFHHLTLVGKPIADAQAAIRLNAEAVKRQEPPIFKDYEVTRLNHTINFFETLRYNANDTNLTQQRKDAEEAKRKAERETAKRQAPPVEQQAGQ